MKGNHRGPGQSERFNPSYQQRSQGKEHGREPVRLTPLRVAIGVLALLLLVISGIGSLAQVKNSYAMSECGILFPCQSPTPSPSPSSSPTKTSTPSPTKTSTPRPSPTPRSTLPPVSSPTAGASPSATTNVSPTTTTTVASIGGAQPDASPTSAPPTTGGNPGNQTSNQSGVSGTSRVAMIVALTILGLLLVLLLSLGIGRIVFRRMLLPRINVKLPPSGARPWSRFRVPNPASLGGNGNALAFAAVNNGFDPGLNGFEQSNNGYAPPNGSDATMQQRFDPTSHGFGPNVQGFEPAHNDLNAPTLAGFGPQDMLSQLPNDYGMPGNGSGDFPDGFMPSTQVFPPSDASVISSDSALNSRYSLPDDPFTSSQGGAPGWPESLG